jgi:MerR family copper efflux transcriptional regulator
MLHVERRFKVKGDFDAHRGALQKDGDLTSRIRFYEKRAVLPKPIRGENGYREYPGRVAKMLSLINDAQRLGFSLNEIRAGLSEAVPKALRSKLENIDQYIKEARARRRQIVKLLKEMGD